MQLSIPAVTSCVVAVLAMFVGAAAIAVSTGPGWRSLRWLGIAALCASVYALCALVTWTAVSDEIRPAVARVRGASVSAMVGSWFVYLPLAQRRKLAGWERWLAGGIFIVAGMWLVPGLFRTSELLVRDVWWLDASYTTTRPTMLGRLAYVALSLVTAGVAGRVLHWWRQGQPGALADFIGIFVQLVAGVSDAFAAWGRIDMPYMLDVGQFLVVLAIGTNLISRFVSDARALERSSAELRAAQKELVRNERLAALGELSAVVAHEVRNPLTVIFNAVSSLRKQSTLSGDTRTLLDILQEEAERLKRVVGELLQFAGPRDLLVVTVSPRPLVDGAAEAARAAYGHGAAIEVETEANLPELQGDEQLLRQALINLISNALQAAGRKSAVRVETKSEAEPVKSISFRVVDDGDGVAKKDADRLFTPFFTTRASGTGLGLAIVKRIAEAHSGEVSWQPGEPRGAAFTLRVPVRRP